DQRGEETGFREGCDELGRIGALAVERTPILARKLAAQRAHRVADLREILRGGSGLSLGHFQTASNKRSAAARPPARYIGSHENTSLERSSGVNEGPSAPLSCWAILSGVQPSERCSVRTARG